MGTTVSRITFLCLIIGRFRSIEDEISFEDDFFFLKKKGKWMIAKLHPSNFINDQEVLRDKVTSTVQSLTHSITVQLGNRMMFSILSPMKISYFHGTKLTINRQMEWHAF